MRLQPPKRRTAIPNTYKFGDLHAGLIGSDVTFEWVYPHSGVEARLTGELRQIYHNGAETTVNITGRENSTGDLEEFTFDHSSVVDVVEVIFV